LQPGLQLGDNCPDFRTLKASGKPQALAVRAEPIADLFQVVEHLDLSLLGKGERNNWLRQDRTTVTAGQ